MTLELAWLQFNYAEIGWRLNYAEWLRVDACEMSDCFVPRFFSHFGSVGGVAAADKAIGVTFKDPRAFEHAVRSLAFKSAFGCAGLQIILRLAPPPSYLS